jgi:hypothetical protein
MHLIVGDLLLFGCTTAFVSWLVVEVVSLLS